VRQPWIDEGSAVDVAPCIRSVASPWGPPDLKIYKRHCPCRYNLKPEGPNPDTDYVYLKQMQHMVTVEVKGKLRGIGGDTATLEADDPQPVTAIFKPPKIDTKLKSVVTVTRIGEQAKEFM
jgi:hypothetical protein